MSESLLDSIDFRPVILAGGSGTRFWPRSRRARAKQVLALDGERSMIQQTVERLKPFTALDNTWIITNKYLSREIADQLPGLPADQYPGDEQIHASLSGYNVITVDVLAKALELGDRSGKTANVVMMGILSTLPPFNLIPLELWLQALKNVNSKPTVWSANYIAFHTGRQTAFSGHSEAMPA